MQGHQKRRLGEAVTNDRHLSVNTETGQGWWTLGISETVPEGVPVAVHCESVDLVCFRDNDGVAHTLLDQCLHRRAPLSLGKIAEEGWVECPYHGWRYDGSNGRCMKVPNLSSAERVPSSYRVPVYTTVERDGFIHVWSVGDDVPSVEAPALECGSLGVDSQLTSLIAYPGDALVDLLLDAPGAVLDLGRLRVINEHRFGDPVRSENEISVTYAVVDETTEPGTLVSEYPYRLQIKLDCVYSSAVAALVSEDGATVARAVMAFLPVKKALCRVSLRGSQVANADDPSAIAIGLRAAIDPQVALSTVDYVSRLR